MSDLINIKPGDRILISRTDRLGDLILSLPLVETIAARYPDCQIEVLASLYASPILENNPAIDKIIRVQNDQLTSSKLYRKDFQHRLKMNNYRAVVAVYPEKHICQLFHRAGIPDRVGTMGRFNSVFFNRHLFHSRKSNKKHECEYNLDFLKFFVDGPTVKIPTVYPADKDLRNATRILADYSVTDSFVLLHPGSGGSADRWPLEHFVKLASLLSQNGIKIIMTGSADEQPIIAKALKGVDSDITNLAGETDLRTLAAMLAKAGVVLANSTGPLHLAAAVGTRVVGLYPGKRIMSPLRWGPIGDGHEVIQPKAPTADSDYTSGPGMDSIKPELVQKAVMKIYRSLTEEKG